MSEKVPKTGEAAMENPFFRRIIERFDEFAVLNLRFTKNPGLKRAIASYFLDAYLGNMVQSGVRRFFFESGSTIAFLGQVLGERLHKDWMSHLLPRIQIETNNFIIFLNFIFEPVPVGLYPWGPPETRYGATFGPLGAVAELGFPQEPGRLPEDTRNAVQDIRKHFEMGYSDHGIIFMAASGVDLTGDTAFPGPHVGSYHNMLFKRALLESDIPKVIFLDEDKIPRPFAKGSCFSICDQDFTWETACREKPLAIAVAFSKTEKCDEVREALAPIGLKSVEVGRPGDPFITLIVANDRFTSISARWRPPVQS